MTDIDKRLDKIEQQLQTIANNQAPVMPANAGIYNNYMSSQNDEIDLRELWNVLWQGKWWVVGITFVFAVAAVIYALALPNIYKSEVLLAPADDNAGGGLAGMAGQFGGLASLAGVNLGGAGIDKTTLALEVLKSREFVSYFIDKHSLLVPLMAAKSWSSSTDELVIDSNIYDIQNNKWVRVVSPPKKIKPSSQEAYEEFMTIFSVSQNKQTNFVLLGLEFFSPSVSKQWLDWLVEDINLILKGRDVAEAERSIRYLAEQSKVTAIADMQAIFYELIEEQTKTIMFAQVRDEYVFKTIDKAILPEKKSKPRRLLICIVSLILGAIVGGGGVLVSYFFRKA